MDSHLLLFLVRRNFQLCFDTVRTFSLLVEKFKLSEFAHVGPDNGSPAKIIQAGQRMQKSQSIQINLKFI